MNFLLDDIKMAFIIKFQEIENCLESGDNNYTLDDLITCISAYETLRDLYKTFIHNCEIDGEKPSKILIGLVS